MLKKSLYNIYNTSIIENINEPIVPEIVLLGLIFDNFLPPIILPNTYPPISVKKHILITYRKKIGFSVLYIS